MHYPPTTIYGVGVCGGNENDYQSQLLMKIIIM